MFPIQHYFFIGILLFASLGQLNAQEICNDAVDNDNDGLIDLNDPDCVCQNEQQTFLIPNPSFEDMTCCPTNEAQLNCAANWIQASQATTDYVHTCGVLGNPFLGFEAPLPMPDGQGAIGFRDGKPSNPNFKEYTGACLLEDMKLGQTYVLDFYVGFHDRPSSRSLTVGIFGSTSCANLPFGGNNANFGCPTNGPGWDQLVELNVQGNNNWVNVQIEFVADKAYSAIVIGPGCERHPNYIRDPYFFFDNLLLFEKNQTQIPFTEIKGDPCLGEISLLLETEDDFSYQWYHNGVAIVGEESSQLQINISDPEGEYLVLLDNGAECFLSETYILETQVIEEVQSINLCEGTTYDFYDEIIDEEGLYLHEIENQNAFCDSIIYLSASYAPSYLNTLVDTICKDEFYVVGDVILEETGDYNIELTSKDGCDSIIQVNLTVLEDEGLIFLPDNIDIKLGEILTLDSNPNDFVEFVNWTNEFDQVVSDQNVFSSDTITRSQWLFLKYGSQTGCLKRDSVFVKVDDAYNIYIPNVFTPRTKDQNDSFIIGFSQAVEDIEELSIYDRWGSVVHNFSGPIRQYPGWQGFHEASGEFYEQGVYVYKLTVRLKNDKVIVFAGDITLLN